MESNNKKSQVGVIQEQGFVMGQNLGYRPVNESELKPNTDDKKDKNSNDKNK